MTVGMLVASVFVVGLGIGYLLGGWMRGDIRDAEDEIRHLRALLASERRALAKR